MASTANVLDVFGDSSCKGLINFDGDIAVNPSGSFSHVGSLQYNPAKFGDGVRILSGDDYMYSPDFPYSGTGYSVSLWVKFTSNTSAEELMFYTYDANDYILISPYLQRVYTYLGGSNHTFDHYDHPVDFADGSYHNVIVSILDGYIRVYVDGTEYLIETQSDRFFRLQYLYLNSNCDVDQIRVFDRGITSSEVLFLQTEEIPPLELEYFDDVRKSDSLLSRTVFDDTRSCEKVGLSYLSFNDIRRVEADALNAKIIKRVN